MKLMDGEVYLSPLEASAMLGVSYKTLQRWVEAGAVNTWVGTNSGSRRRKRKPVKIEVRYTPTGYRFYKQKSIERLCEEFAAA
jgi:DNA-binding transcriptional MerR regulator